MSSPGVRALPTVLGIGLVAAFALGPTPAAGQCTAPDFDAPVAVGVGAGPQGIATGDFDRDGRMDFVTADAGGDTLTVRWGDGGGGFDGTATTLTAGGRPVAILTGYFDRNGTVDVVAVLQANQLVLPFLKTTTGRDFTTGGGLAVDNQPLAIAAGDFDRDGDLDVVTAGLSGAVQFSFNDGAASFTNGSRPTPGGELTGLAGADFNRDGWLDVAAADRTGKEVVLLLNDKAGGWTVTRFGGLVGEPEGIAAGDMDRDGDADLVVPVRGAAQVNVLLNDGGGVFASVTTWDTTADQTGVVLADFDGNGTLDVAVAQPAAGQVVVNLGDGTGKLGLPNKFPVAEAPLRLAAGDFDGDGRPDLVGSGEAVDQAVLLVNGFGLPCRLSSFAGAGRLRVPLGGNPTAMATGDWNGDGIPDLATAGVATLSILTGDGTLGFSPPVNLALVSGNQPKSIAVADFDLDGDPDLAVTSPVAAPSQNLEVYRNVSGTFTRYLTPSVGVAGTIPNAVVTGDFNRDGVPDIVTANTLLTLTFLAGRGDGTFAAAVSSSIGSIPSAAAAGDIDGDLALDIVISTTVNSVQWFRGNGAGGFTFVATSPVGTLPVAVALGDLNGDGRPDLAVANATGNNVSVLLNKGDGTGFYPQTVFAVGSEPRSVVIGNANGDAAPDLVVANRGLTGSHSVTVLYGNGSGGFPTSDSVPGYDQPWPLLLLDADRNGKADLAVASWAFDGALVVVPGDGLGGFGPRRVSPAAGFRSFATGDFDRDGRPDLVTFGDASANLSFLKGQGDGSFASGVSFPTGLASPGGPGVGDFNRDGTLDLVVGDRSTTQVAFIRGDGAGGFGAPALFATGGTNASSRHIAVGDFDHDGLLDIAKTSTFANSVSILFGDVTLGFTGLFTITVGTYPTDIVVLDFNRDGNLDLAVSNFNSGTISLLEGRGTRASPFTLRDTLTPGGGPTGLAVGDFDRDGAPDLVVGQISATPGSVGFYHGIPTATSPPFFDVVSSYTLGDTEGPEPDGVAAADFNADGLLDVLAACRGGGSGEDRPSVRFLAGTGNAAPGAAFSGVEAWTVSQRNPYVLAAEDFDRDGRPDFATGELLTTSSFVSVVLNTNCEARRLRVTRQVSRCNAPLAAFPTQPAVQVEDDGTNPIECNADPVGAAIIPGVPLSGTNPLATTGGLADWAAGGTVAPLSADGTGLSFRLQFDHPTAGITWTWPFSISPVLAISGPTEYCAATQRTFSASPGFDTYRWFVDAAGPRSYLPDLTILAGSLGGGLHNARVDGVVNTCPATANQDFTVYADLTAVSVSPAGPYTITTAETVTVPLAVTATGGGAVTHRWGYRTATGGLITFLPGETGSSYTITGSHFPGQGLYYVVAETTPQCGVARVSNEVEVRVAEATAGDVPPAFTVTSTNVQNRLEWVYPVGIGTVRIRYFTATGPGAWNSCIPPANDGEGLADIPDQSGPLGGPDSYVHTGLTNDDVYCYTIFAGASGQRSVKGRPFDTTVGRVKWAFSTGASTLAPPGLGYGILHVVSDKTVYAVMKGDGGGIWPASWTPFTAVGPTQSRLTTVPIPVGPASRVLYLGSGNAAGNNAIAVDADTGLGLWGQPLGAPVLAGPGGIFTSYGASYDYILVGNRNSLGGSAFFALDRQTGAVAPGWPYTGESGNEIGIVSSQAAVDSATNRAYFTSYQESPGSDSVWCVDLDTAARCGGWPVGVTSALGNLTASPTLRGGRLYVAALNGSDAEVHALDANDGFPQWTMPFAPADGPIKLFILPDVFSQNLYFSTTDNVWSIRDDGSSPVQRWMRNLPGASQPVYFPWNNLVWVGGSDGQLYTLNPTTGLDASPPVTLGDGFAPAGAPTVDSANGFIYLGTTAGVVYAVVIQ